MNAVDLLIGQHRQMEAALAHLLQADDDKTRRTQFEDAADSLTAHVMVEENHFYPAVKAKRTEDVLLESLEEHLSLKRVLADLVALPADDPHFGPKCHVLKEQVEHHHREEEEHLFPQVRKLFPEDQLEELGNIMAAAQAQLLAGKPRELVKEQTSAATELA